jgi:type IV secretory pathway component VirB8
MQKDNKKNPVEKLKNGQTISLAELLSYRPKSDNKEWVRFEAYPKKNKKSKGDL